VAKKRAASEPEAPFPIAGKTFAFTCHFHFASKADLTNRVEAAGGRVVPAVSRNVDVLVVGWNRKGGESAAERKARQLNEQGASIKLLVPDDFRRLFMPTREEVLAMLKGGPEGLERWDRLRADRLFWPPVLDLRGADLRGVTMPKVNLQRLQMDGADLSEADLTEGIVSYLTGVKFDGARLTRAWASNFTKCSFKSADLTEVQHQLHVIEDCDFTGAQLVRLHSPYTYASRSTFRGAVLRGSELDTSRFRQADFTEADLRETDLSKCDLRGATLAKADLRGAKLLKAKLAGADLSEADFKGANLAGADLTGARVGGADFTGANIRSAKVNTLDPSHACGLHPAQAVRPGKAGSHVSRLAALARQSDSLSTDAEVEVDGERYQLSVQARKGLVGAGWGFDRPGYGYNGPSDGSSVAGCLLNFADVWGHATLRTETVRADGKRVSLTDDELRRLAVAAWCEAFGVPVPERVE
jgi:uncharacterized protein YjbI with pentapeptide repeats